MKLSVRATPEAEQQIREIDAWWRVNRSGSADLFLDEMEAAFELLSATPRLGRRYRRFSMGGTRRVLLKSSRYHLYYRIADDSVVVLAVWHAQRGLGPPLRR